jgi:hypothetical protein
MAIAFVLGNGTSRKGIDLDKLKTLGRVYGCNALYRDFAPDVLIATDDGISQEIQKSGYAKINEFYTRKLLPESGAKKITLNYGYSSGPIALSYASAISNIKTIYILGFDYSGVSSKFNNMYADTAHYKKSSDAETYYGNWVDQTLTVIKHHPKVRYHRVIPENALIPNKLKQQENLEHLDLAKFQTIINN